MKKKLEGFLKEMSNMDYKEEWSDEGAVCPYCGYLNSPDDGDYELYDDGLDEWTCGTCGKKFKMRLYVRYSWETSTLDED